MVAEYLGPKRRRPIPAIHRPLGWHPGVFKLVCVTCGELMRLGTAHDTPEVLVEVRAFELAQAMRGRSDSVTFGMLNAAGMDGAEVSGWIIHAHDSAKVPEQAGERAGWLAREIHTHKEQTL
jgi:hypothetical protein